RDVRGLRSLPRSQSSPVLRAPPLIGFPPAPDRAALSVSRSITCPAASDDPAVFLARPRARERTGLLARSPLANHGRAQATFSSRVRSQARRTRGISRHAARGFFALEPSRAGSVHRDSHAALGLSALVPGRSNAHGALRRRTISISRSRRDR